MKIEFRLKKKKKKKRAKIDFRLNTGGNGIPTKTHMKIEFHLKHM